MKRLKAICEAEGGATNRDAWHPRLGNSTRRIRRFILIQKMIDLVKLSLLEQM
jgi:hypothetical protein